MLKQTLANILQQSVNAGISADCLGEYDNIVKHQNDGSVVVTSYKGELLSGDNDDAEQLPVTKKQSSVSFWNHFKDKRI